MNSLLDNFFDDSFAIRKMNYINYTDNVSHDDGGATIKMKVPGFNKKSIDISVNSEILLIEGKTDDDSFTSCDKSSDDKSSDLSDDLSSIELESDRSSDKNDDIDDEVCFCFCFKDLRRICLWAVVTSSVALLCDKPADDILFSNTSSEIFRVFAKSLTVA